MVHGLPKESGGGITQGKGTGSQVPKSTVKTSTIRG